MYNNITQYNKKSNIMKVIYIYIYNITQYVIIIHNMYNNITQYNKKSNIIKVICIIIQHNIIKKSNIYNSITQYNKKK